MLLKIMMAYQLQNEHDIFVCLCVIDFLSRSFLAVTHFVILCSGYRFAEGIRFVHPNAAQLSGIFFAKSIDMKLVYKLVGTLFTR